MNYPIMNSETIADKTTGRILYLELDTVITPRELFKFMDEGFCPVCKAITGTVTSFVFPNIVVTDAAYKVVVEHNGTTVATMTSSDLDEPFKVQ